MTRLWPEGEVIGRPGAQHAAPLHAPSQEVFVWRGVVHCITQVCNCWRIDTHWWARLHEALPDAEPGSVSAYPPSPTDRPRSALSSFGEKKKRLVDVISPALTAQGEPSSPPSGERRKRLVGAGEVCLTGKNSLQGEEGERSVWREYVKVTTDTGLLCLLYQDLHDGGWFLARVYD